ncbi:hypothetical protein ACHAPU_006196 [Fusarium lateritium]
MSSIQHIVLLGSLSNLFLAASKFSAGWYYDSNAITAEGWHSIADLAMDAVTAFTVFLSSQFTSNNMPGSRHIEDFGSLVISSVVCVGGFRTLQQSWCDLNESLPGSDRQLPGVGALWIPLLTIITKEINILRAPTHSTSTNNYASTETSRLYYLIPASEPTENLCANLISVLANRFSIPTIIGYKGKDEYDAKVAHIAKLYSIQRYLHGPAGRFADDLVIVVDGHDVLAQLPVEVMIERYFEITKRHDQVLADRFGLTVEQAHEQGLRQSLVWGAD